jgi:phage recombination protein Bet
MAEEAMVQVTADKIALLTGFKAEEIAIVKNTTAKGCTNTELAYFLNVAKSINLNPFTKEIWCYKDNKGNLLVFAGRDGFLKRAQESQLWNGMTSAEVCANDFFEMDVANAVVNHKPNFKDRGEIIGAYAIVRPKGCDLATVEWADIKVYDKKQFTWSTHKADMIKKVAEIHALKKAFGIGILQSELDWEVKGSAVVPITDALVYISDKQKSTIVDMLQVKDVTEAKFLEYMGVSDIEAIQEKDFNKAMSALRAGKDKQ